MPNDTKGIVYVDPDPVTGAYGPYKCPHCQAVQPVAQGPHVGAPLHSSGGEPLLGPVKCSKCKKTITVKVVQKK
jgi:hypothetical protein